MGLQEQIVTLPTLGLDQNQPRLAGPPGRLVDAKDCAFNRFSAGEGESVSVSPRPAAVAVPTTSYVDSGTGALVTGDFLTNDAIMLLTSVRTRPTIVTEAGFVYLYDAGQALWVRYSPGAIVNRPSMREIRSGGSATYPDCASVGNTVCYTWIDANVSKAFVCITDLDGFVVLQPQELGIATMARVVANTNPASPKYFIAYSSGTGVTSVTLTGSGTLSGFTPIATLVHDYDPWDLCFNPSTGYGLVVAAGSSSGDIYFGAFSGTSTKTGTFTLTLGLGDIGNGFAILTNADAVAHPNAVPIAWFMPAGTMSTIVIDVTDGGGSALAFSQLAVSDATVLVSSGDFPSQISGIIGNSWNECALVVGFRDTNFGGLQSKSVFAYSTNLTTSHTWTTKTAFGVLPHTRGFTFSPASVNTRWCVGMYYPSFAYFAFLGSSGHAGVTAGYMYDMRSQVMVGMYGSRSMNADWLWNLPAASGHLAVGALHVSSVATAAAPGAMVSFPVSTLSSQQFVEGSAGLVTTVAVQSQLSLSRYALSWSVGEAIIHPEYAVLPGPLAFRVSSDGVRPDGIEHAAEALLSTSNSGGSGHWATGDRRSYVFVYERVASDGTKMVSDSSPSVQVTGGGSTGSAPRLVIPTLPMTRHDDVIISIYRTTFANGVEGSRHYKITSDAAPLLNDPTTATVTFDDTADDATIVLNEFLYGGTGAFSGDGTQLSHDMPHGFTNGGVVADRLFMVADDGSLRFTAPLDASFGLWWSDFLFTSIPETVAAEEQDGRLLVSAGGYVFGVDVSSLPDGVGNGTFPVPVQLPSVFRPSSATDTAAGASAALHARFRDGTLWSSEDGQIFLVDRGLGQQVFSLPIIGYLSDGVIAASASDDRRVYILNGSTINTYDTIAKQWSKWRLSAKQIARCGNDIYVADAIGVGKLDATAYADTWHGIVQPVAYDLTYADVSLASVQGAQQVWAYLFDFDRVSDAKVTVTVTPDGDPTAAETFISSESPNATYGTRVRCWYEPRNMESSSVSVTVSVSQPAGGTATGLLTLLSAGISLGVVPGQRRPDNNRIITGG